MTITAKQQADRRKGIGASDVPAIFGADPFKSLFDLWAQKTGRLDADEAGEAARIGNALERGILDLAAERIGAKLVAPKSTFTRGALRANVDAFVGSAKRGSPIVEAKLTSWPEGWGRDGTGEVPDRVLYQVQAQMLACESREAFVARRAEFALYRVERDDDLIAEIEHRIEHFWRAHVLADVPPDGGPSAGVAPLLRREAGKRVAIDAALIEDERAKKTALAAAEAAHEEAKARLIGALGDADGAPTHPGGAWRIASTRVWGLTRSNSRRGSPTWPRSARARRSTGGSM